MPDQTEVSVVSLAVILFVAGVFFLFCALICTRWLRRLLPPQRHYLVPWGGIEILFVVVIYYAWFVAAVAALRITPAPDMTEQDKLNLALQGFWINLVLLPVQLTSMFFVLRQISHTRLYQLGLSLHRWKKNLLMGFTGWLMVMPLLGLFNGVTVLIFTKMGLAPQEHPLSKMAKMGIGYFDWIAIVGTAVVVAPVTEELACRGLLQKWLSQKPWGGAVALSLALGMAILQRTDSLNLAQARGNWSELPVILAPIIFVLLASAAYVQVDKVGEFFNLGPNESRAIYGTGIFFGAMHSFAWPTPIALSLLGIFLGWLAHRTQSLIPVIVLHALFNLVACILIFAQFLLTQSSGIP